MSESTEGGEVQQDQNPVDAPWWRRVLDLEPVVFAGLIRAAVLLGGTLGIALPNGFETWANALVVALYGFAEAILTIWNRLKVTPVAKVVEQLDATGTVVVAGPANNQVPEGNLVRSAESGFEPEISD